MSYCVLSTLDGYLTLDLTFIGNNIIYIIPTFSQRIEGVTTSVTHTNMCDNLVPLQVTNIKWILRTLKPQL